LQKRWFPAQNLRLGITPNQCLVTPHARTHLPHGAVMPSRRDSNIHSNSVDWQTDVVTVCNNQSLCVHSTFISYTNITLTHSYHRFSDWLRWIL